MVIGDALFRTGDLSSYLRAQVEAIGNHVRQHVNSEDLAKTDDEIVAGLLPQARVSPLMVDFDNPTREVKEAPVTVRDMFHGNVSISGVRATKSFPFAGDAKLFELRPSSWSNPPHATVAGNRVVLGFEGRNEPETIKDAVEREETNLREYLANSLRDIEAHNARLPGLLRESVAMRRKQLTDLDNLKNSF